MIKIKVPATTANIGVGFDVLGMSLSLYNIFHFVKSEQFNYINFELKYCNDNNLVKVAYETVFTRANKPIIPVTIKINSDIPIARGLGSSSSCIVAGVLAANYFLNNIFSEAELLNICCQIEGHPDNVAPALLGGLVAAYKSENGYRFTKFDIHPNLRFFLIIPDFELSTKEARDVLPKNLLYEDVINNLSRIVSLPLAFSLGDLEILREILDDKIHEPYRLPLIAKAREIKEIVRDEGCAFCLSGSGPSLLIISRNDEIVKKLAKFNYSLKELTVGEKAQIKEENI